MDYDYGYDIVQETRRTNRLLSLLVRILLRLSARAGLLNPEDNREYLKELTD